MLRQPDVPASRTYVVVSERIRIDDGDEPLVLRRARARRREHLDPDYAAPYDRKADTDVAAEVVLTAAWFGTVLSQL